MRYDAKPEGLKGVAVLQQGQLLFCQEPVQRAQLQESVLTRFPEAVRLTREVLSTFEQQLNADSRPPQRAASTLGTTWLHLLGLQPGQVVQTHIAP
jgi:hypothetical protein